MPTGKVAPGAKLEVPVMGVLLQPAVAVGGVHVAVWLQVVRPAPVFTVMLDGQPDTVGAPLLLLTVTVKEQVL